MVEVRGTAWGAGRWRDRGARAGGRGGRAPVLRELPYLGHEREVLRALDRPRDALLLLHLHARQLAGQDGAIVAHEAVEQRQVGVRDLGNGRLGQRVPAEGYDEG